MKRFFLSLLLTVVMMAPAFAGELVGVTMPDTVSVGGKQLVLNGMGLRRKAIIKVYVAGLYLPQKMKGGKAILGADTERQMVLHFVRSVEKDKICNAWKEGLENNTAGASAEVKQKFDTLCSYMEDMADGGKLVFTYVPGSGTQVEANGKNKGTIAGADFANALFACWIGSSPPSEGFKAGLVAGL